MSSDRNSPPLPSPGAGEHRRASVTGQTFHDLFGRQKTFGTQQDPTQPYPGPITTAAVNAQRRRLSLTTIGLSPTTNQSTPFAPRQRAESLSSVNSGSVDESPFEDDNAPPSAGASSMPATPFARRLSFGARAMRDVRQSNGNQGNTNGEGYNFAENLRSRAERVSMSGAHPLHGQSSPQMHHRAKSVTVMEPPREMPKQPRMPDPMQERILKGDFYMD